MVRSRSQSGGNYESPGTRARCTPCTTATTLLMWRGLEELFLPWGSSADSSWTFRRELGGEPFCRNALDWQHKWYSCIASLDFHPARSLSWWWENCEGLKVHRVDGCFISDRQITLRSRVSNIAGLDIIADFSCQYCLTIQTFIKGNCHFDLYATNKKVWLLGELEVIPEANLWSWLVSLKFCAWADLISEMNFCPRERV